MATNPIGLIATAIAGLVAGIIYLATSSSETAVKIRNFFRKMANGVIEVINNMIMAINKIPGLDIDLIDTIELEEFKKEVEDTTTDVDNLTKSINAIPKTTPITIERKAAPGRIEPKKTGLVATDTSIPETLEGVADIKPEGLESFNEAFFSFSEEFRNSLMNTFSEITNIIGKVGSLFGQMHQKQLTELEMVRETELANIEAMAISEEEKNKRILESDKKFEKKKAELEKKRARRVKAVALMEAVVNVAAAVVKSLPNLPLAIATGALGAAQIATIASTPLPAFADGGIVSGPTVGLMGEYAGANTNPEVIAPLNKLKDMIGGQTIQVQGMISGEDIFLSNDRYSRRKNSY